MDQYAIEGDSAKLGFWIGAVPTLISFALFVPLMFIALYLGAPVISDFMSSISNGPVLHVLSTVGGGLAALGIAVTMHVIGNRSLLPFFFLAYFLVVTSNTFISALSKAEITVPAITTVTWAVFGVIIAILYSLFTAKKSND